MSFKKMVKKLLAIIKGNYYRIFDINANTTRDDICKICEERKYLFGYGYYCNCCGCLIDAKIRVKDEKCPKGKW